MQRRRHAGALLVEDDRMIAEGVGKALRSDGFAVDWVQDSDAALTAVGGEPTT